MCKMASFLWHDTSTVEIAVYDLCSHSATQDHFPSYRGAVGWHEGHYTPDGQIECRTPSGRARNAEEILRRRYPTFVAFFSYAVSKREVIISGFLDLSGLSSAKGLVLPRTLGGFLSLNGLTSAEGLVLPRTLGGSLYLDGLKMK